MLEMERFDAERLRPNLSELSRKVLQYVEVREEGDQAKEITDRIKGQPGFVMWK